MRIFPEDGPSSNLLYAFVDEGGFLEARFAFFSRTAAIAEGSGVVRVTSPQGVQQEFEVAFNGQTGIDHYVTIEGTALQSDIAGVWTIDAFHRGIDVTGSISRFDVVPRDVDGTVHQGRVWSYSYHMVMDGISDNLGLGQHRRANPVVPGTSRLDSYYVWDHSLWVWSENGLIVRVDEMGFNGINSVIAASSMGLVDDNCQPIRQSDPGRSVHANEARLRNCGISPYRLFFEHPDLTMPASAQFFDAATGQIVANHPLTFDLTMPSIDSVNYTQTGTGSVFDGQIAVTLSGQPTTVRVEIDTDGDGSFDGAGDRVVFDNWTLQPGTTNLPWNGLDANGVPVPLDQTIGIRVTMLSSFETHIIGVDIEVRLGGIRLTALNGPLASDPATRYLVNWDDRHPDFFDADGTPLCWDNDQVPEPCPPGYAPLDPAYGVNVNSVNGVHRWNIGPGAANLDGTWGDARSIVTWQVADLSDEAVTVFVTGTGVDITIGDDLIIGDDEQFFCPVLEGGLLPVVVTNHGPADATGVRVSLPDGVTLAPNQDEVSFTAGHTHPVLIGDLAVGETVTFYVYTPLDDNCEWNVPVQVVIDQPNTLPEYRQNDVSVGEVPAPEVDLGIEIEVPVDEETGEPVLPVCPPAGDIELLVTVTNHGPQGGHDITVTLPVGTVVAPEQDHVSVTGDLVAVGDLEVGEYVTFYVISPLSEDCAWDVTVTVEGSEYDPNPDNNEDNHTGNPDTFPGLGGGEETPGPGPGGSGPGGGDGTDGNGPGGGGNLGGGQVPPGPGTPGSTGPGTGTPSTSGGPGSGSAVTGGSGAGSGVGTGVQAPGRLPLTGASGIWIVGTGLALVGGLLLALNNRKLKTATAINE